MKRLAVAVLAVAAAPIVAYWAINRDNDTNATGPLSETAASPHTKQH